MITKRSGEPNLFFTVSSVIASDCQSREQPGALLRIKAKLVNRIKLYPVDVRHTGRTAADHTFVFSIYFHTESTRPIVSRVPFNLRASGRLVRITSWNRIRVGGQNRLSSRMLRRCRPPMPTGTCESANEQQQQENFAIPGACAGNYLSCVIHNVLSHRVTTVLASNRRGVSALYKRKS